ncbi:hypothetical protein SKAU_G00134900 [Synaphobranchus kaupii]|uniref:Retinoic acid receptor alpha n=1 Tax=Synaphobranchus kaupii TaxID=118154 RepID=A0A9Q1FRD2_SYNKA|nr:hypothetical protein SKAU_G00134900 [Synaphobranchus kaupii]
MSGKGNAGSHLSGFPMPPYSYFFPHVLGGLSPPPLPGLPVSGYSTPSPASKCPRLGSETGSGNVVGVGDGLGVSLPSWTFRTDAVSWAALRSPFTWKGF